MIFQLTNLIWLILVPDFYIFSFNLSELFYRWITIIKSSFGNLFITFPSNKESSLTGQLLYPANLQLLHQILLQSNLAHLQLILITTILHYNTQKIFWIHLFHQGSLQDGVLLDLKDLISFCNSEHTL